MKIGLVSPRSVGPNLLPSVNSTLPTRLSSRIRNRYFHSSRRMRASRSYKAAFSFLLATLGVGATRAQDTASLRSEPSQAAWASPSQETKQDILLNRLDEPISREPIQWGPLALTPHVAYRYLYEDGLLAAPGRETNSTTQDFSPGVLLGYGRHLTLDYTPDWSFYSSRDFKNSVGQAVNLNDHTEYEDLTLQISQTYNKSSVPLVETGTQTQQEEYITTVDATVALNSAWALNTILTQDVRLAENFPSSRDWSLAEGVDYQIEPGLTAEGSLAYGYVSVNPGPNMTYIRPEGSLSWKVATKVLLTAHAGFENRRFLSGGASHLNNPVYGLSAAYNVTPQTSLALEADRAVTASLFQDQVVDNRRWSVTIHQRILRVWQLSAAYEHVASSYVSSIASTGTGRDDDISSFSASLATTVLRRVTLSLLYENSRNSSNLPGFGFSQNRVGGQVGYRY